MRVAVISDSHGNLPALEAVLKDIEREGVDHIIMAGDIAFGAPWPGECIDVLRDRAIPAVRGNTDEFLAELGSKGKFEADVPDPSLRHLDNPALAERYAWCVARLTTDQVEYLAALPLRFVLPAPDGAALVIVHATPWSAHPVVPVDAPLDLLQRVLEEAGGAAVTYGHIHRQKEWRIDGRLVVAVGSVGLPFDGDQRAAYAILEWRSGVWEVEFRRVSYPLEQTLKAVRTSGMPGAQQLQRVLETALPPQ